MQTHQKALALREELVRGFPDDIEYLNGLGTTLNNIGVLLDQQGHAQDALAMFRRSVAHGEVAFAKAPQNITNGVFLGISDRNVAQTLRSLGRSKEAEQWYRKTIDHCRQLVRDNPAVPAFHAGLFQASFHFGRFLLEQGRKADSAEPFRQAARALEELPHSTPGDLYNLACVQARVAATIGQDRNKVSVEEKAERNRLIDAVLNSLRRSIEGGSENADHIRNDEDLEILRGRPEFVALVARVKAAEEAVALAKKGESGSPEEKLKAQRDALATRARLVKEDPQSRRYRADQAASQHSVGQILSDLGRNDEAEKELKSALAIRESLAREEPTNARFKLDAAFTRVALGNAAWKANRLSEADRAWKQGLNALETALRDEPEDSSLRNERDTVKVEIADRLLQLGLMEEPGDLLNQVFLHNPSNQALRSGHYWHIQAMLRVLGGDLEGFRASCGEFFKQFRNVDDKFNLYRASMAGPDPLPLDDLKILIAAAEKDLERHPRDDWYILFAAMNHERAGNHARALGILDQTQPGYSGATPFGAMRAIVLHHLGRDDEARKALTEVDGNLSNVYRDQLNGDSPQPISYPETIILRELIRREARSLIDGKSSPQDPYCMLGRARVLAKMGREKDAEQALVAAVAAGPEDPKLVAAFTRALG